MLKYLRKVIAGAKTKTHTPSNETHTQKNENDADKYVERRKLMQTFIQYFPPGVDKIIESYDTPELFERISICKDRKEPNFKSINILICTNNGFIVSVSKCGFVEIWDSVTGKRIKEIILDRWEWWSETLMCQVTDNLIIIMSVSDHCNPNIYILDTKINKVKLTSINERIINIEKFGHNKFITIHNTPHQYNSDQCKVGFAIWDIDTKTKKLNLISYEKNTYLPNYEFNILTFENRMIKIKDAIIAYVCNIESIDLITHKKENIFLERRERINNNYFLINNMLFVTRGNGYFNTSYEHIVLDARTLDGIKTFPEFKRDSLLVVHIRDNLIAMIFSNDISYHCQMLIYDTKNNVFTLLQQIQTNQRIRCATNHKNGLITVNESSEIKIYDFV